MSYQLTVCIQIIGSRTQFCGLLKGVLTMKHLLPIVCIGILFIGLASYVSAAVDPGTAFLVWTFDEGSGATISDKSSQGNDGEITGGVEWVDAKYGKGLELDGATGYIKTSTANGVGNTAFTECLWIRFNDLNPENQFGYISCTGTANARFFYYSTWSSAGAPHDAIHAGTIDTAGNWGRGIATGRVFQTDQWYFVAGVIDTANGFIKVYVDGELVQEQAIDVGDTPGTPTEIWVGSSPEGYTWIAGTIDDVALFNVALGEDDIKEIMENGIASFFDATTAVDSPGKLPMTWGDIKTH
jgi:hypothetical protein